MIVLYRKIDNQFVIRHDPEWAGGAPRFQSLGRSDGSTIQTPVSGAFTGPSGAIC